MAGGAAVAAMRLLKAQQRQGLDAEMLTLESGDRNSGAVPMITRRWQQPGKAFRFLAEMFSFVPAQKGHINRFTFSPACFGYNITRHPLVQQADVLHLHWVNQGFLSLKNLSQLFDMGKPIVWTLHDMWPFTGGCHYSGDCLRFAENCGDCPLLRHSGSHDRSYMQHLQKQNIYQLSTVAFVGCSHWMMDMAARSGVFRGEKNSLFASVFNPIDTSVFKPASKADARRALRLPVDKKLVLFGAANLNDPRKGMQHLATALHRLRQQEASLADSLELVAFGKNSDAFKEQVPFPLHSFNVIAREQEMVRLYQAADLFVLPSLQDNLPNTVMEAMACGTPVAAFKTGGVPEMISHKQNGYLAPLENAEELAAGIRFLLTQPGIEKRQTAAREFVMTHCTPQKVAGEYLDIYQRII